MPAVFYLLTSAFLWNFGVGLTYVAVPLYAYSLGMSGIAIGILVAVPSLMQVPMRFVSGAVAYRWGERAVLMLTYGNTVVAGLVLTLAEGFWVLFLAQLISNFSRGMYWTGAQGMAARLPGERSVQLGWLQVGSNLGMILGIALTGFLVTAIGFHGTFLYFSVMSGLAVLASLGLPRPLPAVRTAGVLHHFLAYMRSRRMLFAIVCSFWAAQAFSLIQSFYPVLLVQMGFSTGAVGSLLALWSIGGVVCGLVVARLLTPDRRVAVLVLSLVGTGVAVGLSPLATGLVWVAMILIGLGVASIAIDLNSQLVAARVGEDAGGGASIGMAIGGLGWGLSHFVIAAVVGAMVDLVGVFTAFHVLGAAVAATAVLVAPLHRWAFAAARPAADGEGAHTITGQG